MTGNWTEVMGTAHRKTPVAARDWLRAELPSVLTKLRDQYGAQRATAGMAVGGDHLFGYAAEQIGMPLRAAIPYPSQPLDGLEINPGVRRPGQRWTRQQRADWEHLRAYAERTGGAHHVYDRDPRSVGERVHMLFARNHWMLQRSHAVVALWDPERLSGGTYRCIEKAVSAGMPVVLLDLSAYTITMPRPQDWAARLDKPALAVAKQLW